MIGLLITDSEQTEIEYIIKCQLDELLLDLDDSRIEPVVKGVIIERYRLLFQLFRRVTNQSNCLKYMPNRIHLTSKSKYE
ncbi:hypothetical protein [Aquibacillus saliphilus]|uniref:hypothetical protein n=1 Tax=Aquibacillus saliphilus TaxID=1909422 RepID=UPI001CEFC8EF|nr:hypothetical protein [Aquibacillus saliphilus]